MTENADEVMDKKRSGEAHEGTARVVCRKCNNGWMSNLQANAKSGLLPLATGETAMLFVKQQRSIAAWVAMFCMVVEQREGDRRFIASSVEERRAFMRDQVPSRSWRIWAGYNPDEVWPTLVHRTAAKVIADDHDGIYWPRELPIVPNTQTTTVAVGKVLFHVASSSLPAVLRNQRIDLPAMPQIWPIRRSPVVWPPRHRLTAAQADAVATGMRRRLREVREKVTRER